jgi:hypothetical protein
VVRTPLPDWLYLSKLLTYYLEALPSQYACIISEFDYYYNTMSSRNRNRQTAVKDGADEEHSLWSQLQADARKIDAIIVRIFIVTVQPFHLTVLE